MQSFFAHYSMEFGLQKGWNLDCDYSEFVEKNEEVYKNSNCFKIGLVAVTEWDIYQLSLGLCTEGGKAMLDSLIKDSENTDMTSQFYLKPFLVSNHSGSSDMLTPKKVMESYKEFKPY